MSSNERIIELSNKAAKLLDELGRFTEEYETVYWENVCQEAAYVCDSQGELREATDEEQIANWEKKIRQLEIELGKHMNNWTNTILKLDAGMGKE